MAVTPSRTTLSTEALTLFLFLLAGTALYAPILGSFFLSDDFILVDAVRRGGPLGIWWRGADFFRPLVSLSLYLDHSLWGLRPLGYHLTNVLAHSGCAFLVYRIALALGLDRLTARLGGIFFLLLPSHSEPVAWISGRTDVLAALLGLAALDLYLRFRSHGRPGALALAVGLFLAGLGAKESVLPVFAIVFLTDVLLARPAAGAARRRRRVTLVFVGAVGAYLLVRRAVLGKWLGGYGAAVHLKQGGPQLLANLVLFPLRALGWQLPAALLPRSLPTTGVQQAALQALRSHLPGWALLLPAMAGAAGAAALSLWVGRAARRRLSRPQLLTVGFCLGSFYLALLPVLSLTVSLLSSDGERFLYFPSAFAVLAAVALLRYWLRGRWAQRSALALLLGFYAAALEYANHSWQAAGQLAAELVAQLRKEPAAPPLLLANLPDSLGGAFVFRNGLEAALRLFDPVPRQVLVLSRHTLLDRKDAVTVTVTAPSPPSRPSTELTIQLAEPRAYFFSITPPPAASGLAAQLTAADRGRCVFHLREPAAPPALRYYSRGAFHPLLPAASSTVPTG